MTEGVEGRRSVGWRTPAEAFRDEIMEASSPA